MYVPGLAQNLLSLAQLLKKGEIKLEYCNTDFQPTDMFTKALSKEKLKKFQSEIGDSPVFYRVIVRVNLNIDLVKE